MSLDVLVGFGLVMVLALGAVGGWFARGLVEKLR
jgi:hypothetical protein